MNSRNRETIKPGTTSRRATYQERLLAAALQTNVAALTPVEGRLVDIVAKLGIDQFLGLACMEHGHQFESGKAVPDRVIARSIDLALVAASRVEDRLQHLRNAIEEEGESRQSRGEEE